MNLIIGNNLKLLRQANKFSQEQVSSFFSIQRTTYTNYENGDREVPMQVLEKASNLFGCDLHLLFEENSQVVNEMLVCAFRVDNLSSSDMAEIANFKDVVKNYLKLDQLLER